MLKREFFPENRGADACAVAHGSVRRKGCELAVLDFRGRRPDFVENPFSAVSTKNS